MDDTDQLLNDDNDDLDREVESCLTGAGHSSGHVASPSSCSFYSDQGDVSDSASFYSTGTMTNDSDSASLYSTATGHESSMSDTASFYSTRTMLATDSEDTMSYCSVDTLTGARDTEDVSEEAGDHAGDTTPPSAPAGASVNGSTESLVSDDGVESVSSEVSVAGQLNRRLGLLLGYTDMSSLSLEQDTASGGLTANIMGYEIICGHGDKYTVGYYRII